MTQTPTGYEAIAGEIKRRGIETVFGLMSDDTALLLATLDAMGVRFVGARHENVGVAMAEGHAAATGRMAVAVIGRGPAAANGLHGAVYAQRTGSRVLLIFGAASMSGPPDMKDLDAVAVFKAAGFRTFVASHPDTACEALADAAAAVERFGTAVLLLPANVQLGRMSPHAAEAMARRPAISAARPLKRVEPRAAALDAAAALLRASRRPLLLAGYGAHLSGAREAIEGLAGQLGAVLGTTLKAKDMFRGHDYNAGVVGSFSMSAGRRYTDQADCILALGASLNPRTTGNGTTLPAQVPLIQVDTEAAHIGRWFPADVSIVGDVRRTVELLAERVGERPAADKPFHVAETRRDLANADLAAEFQPASTQRTMDPRLLAIELDRLLPRDRNTVYDAGNFIQIEPYVSVPHPGALKNSLDFASIGMGFGNALGFALGAPERPTVLFIGDGGFLMTLGELETTVRENIPLVIVLMNDCAYGAEMHYLKERNMATNLTVFPDVDFAPVAAAFGFDAHTVRTLDELRGLAPLLASPDGPIFLDCKINGAVAAAFVGEAAAKERERERKLDARNGRQ